MKKLLLRSIIAVAILLLFLLLLLIGLREFGIVINLRNAIQVLNMNKASGIASPSENYRLLEMADNSGRYLYYMVVSADDYDDNGMPVIIYATEDCLHHARYIKWAGWANHTDDFFVYSADVGIIYYRYDGETWSTDTPLMLQRDENGDIIENSYSIRKLIHDEYVYELYDEEDLPDYLRSRH